MTEIEVVVDVKPSPNSLGFIVVKRRLVADGGTLRFIDEPHESPLALPSRRARVWLEVPQEATPNEAILAHVQNIGSASLPDLLVAFSYEHEVPPQESSYPSRRVTEEIGGSINFSTRDARTEDLQPGETRMFYLSREDFEQVIHLGRSLQTDRYSIVVLSRTEEVANLSGFFLQAYFDQSRVHLADLARMVFLTLQQENRLAIMDAAVGLLNLPRDRWTERGRKLRDENTHLLEVAPDYRVLVQPTDGDGVEVLDILRQPALDAFAELKKAGKR